MTSLQGGCSGEGERDAGVVDWHCGGGSASFGGGGALGGAFEPAAAGEEL